MFGLDLEKPASGHRCASSMPGRRIGIITAHHLPDRFAADADGLWAHRPAGERKRRGIKLFSS
jgi:hypothetical protein